MLNIPQNIHKVRRRIEQAVLNTSGTKNNIKLLAVSKRHNSAGIRQAYACDIREFGENYLQEALEKITALSDLDIHWHFIGPIQSNKTKAIAEHFAWVHTVDRLKVASRLSKQRPSSLPPLNICIQINIDDEESKSGIAPEETLSFAKQVDALPNLRLRGLMCIPKKADLNEENTNAFQKTKVIFDHIATQEIFHHWDTLSMGMSTDLETAIANGANIVRIGTDIFGSRS